MSKFLILFILFGVTSIYSMKDNSLEDAGLVKPHKGTADFCKARSLHYNPAPVADLKEAIKYYICAAEKGYQPAIDSLTSLADIEGSVEAAEVLGQFFATSKGDSKSLYAACRWYKKAAELGSQSVVRRLEKLAENYPYAQCALGEYYSYGQQKFMSKALEWLGKAAKAGCIEAVEKIQELAKEDGQAQHLLGLLYLNGQGVEKNLQEAFQWFTKSSENGFIQGTFRLGKCYEEGKGVQQNKPRAIEVYRSIAPRSLDAMANLQHIAKKDDDAHFALLQLQEVGAGVQQDISKAYEGYRALAEKGHAQSQYFLAGIAENKTPDELQSSASVIECYENALHWYDAAAKSSYSKSIESRERVAQILDSLRFHNERHGGSDFNGLLLVQMKQFLNEKQRSITPEVYYWFAYIMETISIRCSEAEKNTIMEALKVLTSVLTSYPKHSQYVRLLVKFIAEYVDGSRCDRSDIEGTKNAIEFACRLSKGIVLIGTNERPLNSRPLPPLKLAHDSPQDPRIDVYNCLIKYIEQSYDIKLYADSVNYFIELFNTFFRRGLITDALLMDKVMTPYSQKGDLKSLKRFLMSSNSKLELVRHDFKRRIIKIAHIFKALLNEQVQAEYLITFAKLGCKDLVYGEEETRKICSQYENELYNAFYDNALNTLGMLIALRLENIRKELIKSMIPEQIQKFLSPSEFCKHLSSLTDAATKTLCLTDCDTEQNNLEKFDVRSLPYCKKGVEQIKEHVMSIYTAEYLVKRFADEINYESRLVFYPKIVDYCKKQYPTTSDEVLKSLYDDKDILTKEGAQALLYHFGYLEAN